MFQERNIDWISELPSVIKQYKNTTQNSIKTTPNEASMKMNETKSVPIFQIEELDNSQNIN